MTHDEFVTGFDRLQAAFEHNVKDATATLYYDVLRAYNARDWHRAVRDAIAAEDRWPRVGTLLRHIRDYAVRRHECEQQARAEAARQRQATGTPSRLGEVATVRDLMEIGRRLTRGEIGEAEAAQQHQAWLTTQPPDPPMACRACCDTGVLHWETVAPAGHPFAGNRYATAGRCRCAAGSAWGIPWAPAVLQPTGSLS